MKLFAFYLTLLCWIIFPFYAAADAQKWDIDRKKSFIEVRGFKDGQPFTSVFQAWNAEIYYSPDSLKESRGAVTIDPRSASTGAATFRDYLITPSWFNPASTPYATFQIISLTKDHGDLYNANGILHLYNKTRSLAMPVPGISLPILITVQGNKAEFKSDFTFSAPDFRKPQSKNPTRRDMQNLNFRMMLKGTKSLPVSPQPGK